jgi:hypothetical protein
MAMWPVRFDRVRERAHDVLRLLPKRQSRRVRDVLRQRAARDRQLRAVDQVRVREEVLEQRGDAPHAMQVLHHVPPGRLQIRQVRRAVCHGLEVVDRELDVSRAGHGQEMEDLVKEEGESAASQVGNVVRESSPRLSIHRARSRLR